MLYYNKNKSKKKHYIRILVIVAVIIISSLSPSTSSLTSKIVNFVATPFAAITSLVTDTVNSAIDFTLGTKPNREMVDRLTDENQTLQKQINELEFTLSQMDDLRNYQNFLDKYDGQTTKASIILLNNEEYFTEITIDKGATSGVEVGDIIVSSYTDDSENIVGALVGQVTHVDATSSKVSTVLDEKHNISFVHSNSNVTGIINEREDLTLEGYMLEKTDINVGDSIYTSGIGGIYPRGIYIGKVSSVGETTDRLSQILTINSPVQFTEIYEVMVISYDNFTNGEQ